MIRCLRAPAVFGGPAWREIVELRRRVLRFPLGMDFTNEQLAAETEETHAGVWLGADREGFQHEEVEDPPGTLVACALIKWGDSEEAKVRQVAVDPAHQGQGLGRAVMEFCEIEAGLHGVDRITLHARDTAVPFYLAIGYHVEGEPFEEIGIPHRLMVKRLDGASRR